MKTALLKSIVFGLFFINLLAGGCSSRSVNIIAADDICKKSIEVHLVGVNRYEKDTWETMSMTDYWTPPENQLRKSAKAYTHVITFGQGPCEIVLDKKDPICSIWKSRKAEYLLILADLRGIFSDLPGNADARRLSLPAVNSDDWGKLTKTINIRIEGGNIVPLTIPKENSFF
ncbi:MAG: hypothetical protein H8D56_19365 [Planctomycetes bacterium]|nr:hypothetical protein [Planctomycetota bacterium]MBL7142761.1 hypothetical protein [Phycisphaerae bacterium]